MLLYEKVLVQNKRYKTEGMKKKLFICKLFISLNSFYRQLCLWTYYDGSKSVSFKFHVSLTFLGSSDAGLSLND